MAKNTGSSREKATQSFKEIWYLELPSVKAASFSSKGEGAGFLSASGDLTLVDSTGSIKYTLAIGADVKTISLADNLEILAVNESGQAILINQNGEILWKKRLFPVLHGTISSSGQFFTFLTKEPAVVLTDRLFKVKWSYRNLLIIPPELKISGNAEALSFMAKLEAGPGITTLSEDGKPLLPLKSSSLIQDFAVSESGRFIVGIDRSRGFYFFDCQEPENNLKIKLDKDFSGISFADEPRQTLVFTPDGLIRILDGNAYQVYEYKFPHELLDARISSDGQQIWFSSPSGRIGVLRSHAFRQVKQEDFIESPAPSGTSSQQMVLQKHWTIELPKAKEGDKPLLAKWARTESVEYLALWDGATFLSCLSSENAEEVWKNQIPGSPGLDLNACGKAESIIFATGNGVMGLRPDGSESFKLFGNFRKAHVFENGKLLFLAAGGKAHFFLNPNHFSHILPFDEEIETMVSYGTGAFLLSKNTVISVNQDGAISGQAELPSQASSASLIPNQNHLFVGTRKGDLNVINLAGDVIFSAFPGEKIAMAFMNSEEDSFYCTFQSRFELIVFRNRTMRKTTLVMNSIPRCAALIRKGLLVATEVDEILLVGINGEILCRHNFPDKVLSLNVSRDNENVFVLGENSLTKISFSPETVMES